MIVHFQYTTDIDTVRERSIEIFFHNLSHATEADEYFRKQSDNAFIENEIRQKDKQYKT